MPDHSPGIREHGCGRWQEWPPHHTNSGMLSQTPRVQVKSNENMDKAPHIQRRHLGWIPARRANQSRKATRNGSKPLCLASAAACCVDLDKHGLSWHLSGANVCLSDLGGWLEKVKMPYDTHKSRTLFFGRTLVGILCSCPPI